MTAVSDPDVADEVISDLAAARRDLQQLFSGVEELRGCARSAERALQDVEDETARARVVPEDHRSAAYLRSAGDQIEVLRQRCALSATVAAEVEQRLVAAKGHLTDARGRLDHYDPDLGVNPPADANLGGSAYQDRGPVRARRPGRAPGARRQTPHAGGC